MVILALVRYYSSNAVLPMMKMTLCFFSAHSAIVGCVVVRGDGLIGYRLTARETDSEHNNSIRTSNCTQIADIRYNANYIDFYGGHIGRHLVSAHIVFIAAQNIV